MSTTLETPLKRLSRANLAKLAQTQADTCVTILMPTYRSGRETLQGGPRLKNLLDRAAETLKTRGADPSLLAPIRTLTDSDAEFWQHQDEGLAIFLDGGDPKLFCLPDQPTEVAIVDSTFFLKPLVGKQADQGDCFVVALSWDEADLYRVSGTSIRAAETDQFPAKFNDLVLPRDPEEQLQYSSHRQGGPGAAGTPMYHGQGEGEQKIEADRRAYLKQIGERLSSVLYGSDAPLIALGTEEVLGHLKAVCDLSIRAELHASPRELSTDAIRKRVIEQVRSLESSRQEEFAERFGNALALSQAASEIGDTLRGAVEGRIDTLWVAEDRAVRGQFEPSTLKIVISENESDVDLVNRCVVETLKHGGSAFACKSEQLPEACNEVAAIYRY